MDAPALPPPQELARTIAERLPGIGLSVDPAELGPYAVDDSGLGGPPPLAILRPRTIPEVRAIVAEAPGLGLKLRPISSGKSHHRGDTVCAARTAIVDMSAFDEVVRVDRRNRVVMLEAAADFASVTRACRRSGLRPFLPLCPRPGKSALTAWLEREPTIHPRHQWDLSDPLLCLEVVLGQAELFRTGGAAGPGTLEQQWAAGDAQKSPMGPGQSDVARLIQGAQGGLGIVTWCTAKAEPIPSAESLHVLRAERIEPLVEITYGLLRRNHPEICFLVDGPALHALAGRPGGVSVEAAAWNLVFSLAEPRYARSLKRAYVGREVHDLCARHGVPFDENQQDETTSELHRILTLPDHPANDAWWKLAGRPAARELFFQTTLDRVEGLLARAGAFGEAHGLGEMLGYVQPQLGGRCCHLELVLPHEGDHDRVNEQILRLARELQGMGAYFSRPYGPWRELAWHGASTAALFPKLKTVLDPLGVFAGAVGPSPREGGAS